MSAPEILDLPVGVDLWRCPLDRAEADHERLEAVLSEDERERARQYVFDGHRRRFVAARASLRAILARYLGCRPDAPVFSYEAQGKPRLAASTPARGGLPSFNVSHAADLALVAVTSPGRSIGVDVEAIRDDLDFLAIAERFFSPAERACLVTFDRAELGAVFFACWTRKESFIKCSGLGLSLPLDGFDVSVSPPGTVARLLGDRTGHADLDWSLHDVPTDPGYVAAVTVAGPWEPLRLFTV